MFVKKHRIYEIVQVAKTGDQISRIFDQTIIVLIILNAMALVLETVSSINVLMGPFFKSFEVFSVAVFTVEYILRLWTSTHDTRYNSAIIGRLKYVVTPMAIIDLIAILPFFLPFLIPIDLRFIRLTRILRMLRLLKLGRYSVTIQKLGRVIAIKKEELIITIGVVFLVLVFASSLMYYCENPAQPKVFSSIPAAMWWGIATLTTVGYGDVYPITPIGKVLGAIIALLGVGMVALPTGIIGSGFMEEIQKGKQNEYCCPHCGKNLEQ